LASGKKEESQLWAPPTMTLNVASARTHRWALGSSPLGSSVPTPESHPEFRIQLRPF